MRVSIFAYGVICYAVFFGTFLYGFGFMGNLMVPKAIDSARAEGVSFATALGINTLLLLVFAVQHSLMARPWFKARWTRVVPEPAERSTYVLFSSLALIALFWLWQPMGGIVWNVENPTTRMALYGLFASGWLLVLVTTFLINHFDLFGLRQVWLYLNDRPYTHLKFKTPGVYKLVRHPLYVGWLVGFWATPTMTVAHLFFALVTTAYILMAIRWEERDLIDHHGKHYTDYRNRVGMLVPKMRRAES
ncbi:MAG: isoprenylcysteine carboxylmethyltransferase family protein [Phycisphaeraceae bacterium]|nr:isoprenylcysteine carboxylmethyltransferase family protein [Phycisphaeraceae bacterium]